MVCGLSICCGYFLCFPFIVYCLHRSHITRARDRKDQFFKIRHPSLVYMINILCILIILFERSFLAFNSVFSFSSQIVLNISFEWVYELVYCILWFSLWFIIGIKWYLLYFVQQFNLAIVNQAWQKNINIGVTGMYCIYILNLCTLYNYNYKKKQNIILVMEI